MIEFVNGNIFQAKVQALVNPVNTVGVMGAGLAKEFKTKYPTNFVDYKRACSSGKIRVGKIFYTKIFSSPPDTIKYILNFPTKDHWKNPSKIQYISDGLDDLLYLSNMLGINSVAIPALGCGLGQLEWNKVKDLILEKLSCSNMHILVYPPR